MIYRKLVPERIEIDGIDGVLYCYAPIPSANLDRRGIHRSQWRSRKKPDFQLACTSLMQSCRQVADEMRPLLDRCTVWCVSPGIRGARRWINRRSERCLDRLAMIEILPARFDGVFMRDIQEVHPTSPYSVRSCLVFAAHISVVLRRENNTLWPTIWLELHTSCPEVEPLERFKDDCYKVAETQRCLRIVEARLIAS